MEERFMIDDGGGEVDSTSAPPGRLERSGSLSLVMQCTQEGGLTLQR
jgi:hypothetical protein